MPKIAISISPCRKILIVVTLAIILKLGASEIHYPKWDFLQPARPFVTIAKEGSNCQIHGERFFRDFINQKLWALKMHDSSGKFPSGILNGNVHALGDFRQCLSIKQDFEDGVDPLDGKYCWVQTFIEVENSSLLSDTTAGALDLVFSHYATHSSYDEDYKFFPSFTPISWAFCVPNSCDIDDVTRTVQSSLQHLNATPGISVRVKSSKQYCWVKDDRPGFFHGHARPLSLFFVAIISMAVLGALLECMYVKTGERRHEKSSLFYKIVTAFSIKRNWNTLIDTSPFPEDVTCLHGIRFFTSVLIYVIHRAVFRQFIPTTNRTEVAEGLEGPGTMIFRCFWNHVDTFVLISGFLTAYFFISKLQKGKAVNIWNMYFTRFYKFAPLNAVMTFIIRNYGMQMTDGPCFGSQSNYYFAKCQTNYWRSLIYISNFDGLDGMCWPSSHQLMTDMQAYLLAPWIVLLLWRCSRKGVVATGALVLAVTFYKGWLTYSENILAVLPYGANLTEVGRISQRLYFNPIHRLAPYLCGILLGHFLKTRGESIKISKGLIGLGWCVATASYYFCFFYMRHASYPTYVNDPVESAIYGMLQPLVWSYVVSWVIFVCHTGNGGKLNDLLSWKGFIIFSRISYAFYLTQIGVILVNIGKSQVPIYSSPSDAIDLNEFFVVIFMSVVCTLLFVLPLGELANAFSNRTSRGEIKKKS